jgi:hypothetical protein
MSEGSISLIVTVAIIAIMLAWVPMLNFLFSPRNQFAAASPAQKDADETHQDIRPFKVLPYPTIPAGAVLVSSLSSQRLRNQSRDLRQALSARDSGASARSRSTLSSCDES